MTELALTKKDFTSDQEVRWCPGCGDFSELPDFVGSRLRVVQEHVGIHFAVGVGGLECVLHHVCTRHRRSALFIGGAFAQVRRNYGE